MSGTAVAAPTDRRHTGLILGGLMLGILLAALDQTVVGTSLPQIVTSLGGFEYFPYLFAAYMLASTLVIPIAGKLSDLYGARPVLLTGMTVFLLGSALCGTATSMTQLVLYRGIQGLGGGAIFPVALATIADLYPPKDRAKIGGAFGATFGLSSVIGPFLGGWIVDNVHLMDVAPWRWVFYVNLPVGIPALIIVALFFPRLERKHSKPMDIRGMVTLSIALTTALLITVLGGDTYAWASPEIFGMAALSLAALATFVYVETKAADPILPLGLFKDRIFTLSVTASLFMGAGMFGVISFMPTFMQGVVGLSATYSGAVLTPLTLMIVFGSIFSGRLTNRLGYKLFMLLGCGITVLGFLLLATLTKDSSTWVAIGYMMVVGLGLGFTIQTYVIAVQNAVPRAVNGVATSSVVLFRSLGATFGVTVLGLLLTQGFQADIGDSGAEPAVIGKLYEMPTIHGDPGALPQALLTPDGFWSANSPFWGGLPYDSVAAKQAALDHTHEAIVSVFTQGIHLVFFVAAIACVAALIVTLFIENRPLRGREEEMGAAAEAQAPTLTH